jgi:death on curing protein
LPNEPNWLPIEVVIDHHRLELAETGEPHFLRDVGLLESALARPRNAFAYGEEDIVILAVKLLAAIAQAHAFEQGNKRTAFAATRLFLSANGYDTRSTIPFGGRMKSSISSNTDRPRKISLARSAPSSSSDSKPLALRVTYG